MTKPSVYLAGPIRGLSFQGAADWRAYARQKLQPEIEAFSPLRGKEFLQNMSRFLVSQLKLSHYWPPKV